MRADVLIVGGGLAGCATAYFLARDGVNVLLVERFDLNTRASGSNAGSIHAQIPHEPFVTNGEAWARAYAPTIPLMMESIARWKRLEAELGADLELSTTGGLLVAETDAQMREVARKAAIERSHGLPVDLLSRADLRRLAPYVSERMIGGAFCPIEGKASPLHATPALARAAEAHGARLMRDVELFSLERQGGGGFRAETSAGPIRAGRVVDCAGADAGRVAAMVGLDLPIEGHPIQVSVTEATAPLVPHLVYFAGEKLTLKQTPLGALLIGGGWPARFDAAGRPAASLNSLRRNLLVAQRVVPAVGAVRLLRTWPAVVNGTADWKPVLGEAPGVPGFFVNMVPWMGFTAGPVAARIVADLVLGRSPEHDLSQFSALRYG